MDITNEIKELSGSTVTKKHMVELFGSDKLKDSFKKYNKIKSVTPGQACVFYIDNQCIGGGTIKEVRKNDEKRGYLAPVFLFKKKFAKLGNFFSKKY